jgi:uncharacterized circularly permuted ATP-grasp superfamily protein
MGHIESGVLQRSKALNKFLYVLYHDKNIIKAGIVPLDLISSSENYLRQMNGVNPPGGIYNHISGTDLIKHSDGKYYVLEDNIRCPSGRFLKTLHINFHLIRQNSYSSEVYLNLQYP